MQLGRYQILKQLASGSVADVLLARASGLEGFARHVVIKRIRPDMAAEERFAKAFLDEARIAGSLHHQNIVTVHDIGEQDGTYFFAMEYVHGEDARRLIARVRERGEHVPLEHAISIVMAAATGLHYAHEQSSPSGERLGLVHRDVSPANILIGYDGSVKIVDFGMAKAVARSTQTSTAVLKGKTSHMSPEQCLGAPLDRRTDIFSLGIVLFELITAQRLFKGINEFMTMAAIVEGEIPRPSTLRSEVPAALDEIVMRALQRSPESRYQTAEAFRESLEAFALATELRTSAKALSDYLTGLFGHRPEPWEPRAAAESQLIIDEETTSAKGLVAAPAKRDEMLARVAPRADSPLMRADADGEWDDDDEHVPTIGAKRPTGARSARAGSESSLKTAPTPALSPNDSQPLDAATVVLGDGNTVTRTDSEIVPVARDAAPALQRPRPTGSEEIDSHTVLEPPIFDAGFSSATEDDEFTSEPATELAADDADPPWKRHADAALVDSRPRVRSVAATVPRSKLAQKTSPPAGPSTSASSQPPSRPTPTPRPTPPPSPPSRPTPPPSRPTPPPSSEAPTRVAPPVIPAEAIPAPPAVSAGASPATLLGPAGNAPVSPPPAPPPAASPPTLLGPPAGNAPMSSLQMPASPMAPSPLQAFAPMQPGYPGAPPSPAAPPGLTNDLRSKLRLLVAKHATRLWIAGGVLLILLVILAARGCGDDHPTAERSHAGAED